MIDPAQADFVLAAIRAEMARPGPRRNGCGGASFLSCGRNRTLTADLRNGLQDLDQGHVACP